jgi:Ca2+-transporting ATPase
MKKKPRDPKESFFARGAGFRAILGGTLIGVLTLVAFYFGLREHGYSLGAENIPEDVLTYARTMSFVVLAASQLFYSLTMRNSTKSIFQVGLFSNKYLVGAIIVGFILQLGVISVPFFASAFKVQMLSVMDWGLVILFALIPLAVNEIVKLFVRIKEKNN